jgi:tetratricopeptide (TPR) repeat protein
MRYFALALLRRFVVRFLVPCLAACGGASNRPTLRSVEATPSQDLARAKSAMPQADGHDTKLEARDPRVVDLDIIRITAHPSGPGGDPELTSVASADLFKQANDAAKAGRQREAIATYRQLVTEFPDSQFAPVSLFNIAAVYDAQADLAATIATLDELVAKYPSARESIDGHLYIAALQADHQQWAEAAATLDAVLARANLTFADRVEAFARKGYVALEQHQYDKAETALSDALAAWRAAPRIEDPYYIAMAHYYRGELMHKKFLEAPVRGGDDQMVADLEAKRVLAAKAYDRWRESLGFKQAYWATASGYQMSQIFVELWEAHVKAPYPQRIDVATRPTYVADVHTRVRQDLEKALEGHRMNVELAKAYGVDTPWSKGSEQQAATIVELLAKDTAGAYVTPLP